MRFQELLPLLFYFSGETIVIGDDSVRVGVEDDSDGNMQRCCHIFS